MSEIDVRDLRCENCSKFSHCNNNDLICIEKFQQLKAENEGLKNKLKIAMTAEEFVKTQKEHTQLDRKTNKYKQCLDEIEDRIQDLDNYSENNMVIMNDILQLIKQAKEGGE